MSWHFLLLVYHTVPNECFCFCSICLMSPLLLSYLLPKEVISQRMIVKNLDSYSLPHNLNTDVLTNLPIAIALTFLTSFLALLPRYVMYYTFLHQILSHMVN